MKRHSLLSFALAMAACAAAQAAPGEVTVTLEQYLVKSTVTDGKTTEELVASPETVVPGAILEQHLIVENTTARELSGRVMRLPVPKGTTFVGLSATDYPVTYSLDGGKTFAARPVKTLTETVAGKAVTREVPAPLNEYTMIRWSLPPLAAQAKVMVAARFKVN